MLVIVKNRVTYSFNQRQAAIEAMEKVFTVAKIETGVCMLFLIGLNKASEKSSSMSGPFGQGKVVSTIIVVPTADRYGATNLALCSTCGGGEESKVLASHADLALGAQGNRLLQKKKKRGPI
ncbi:unnamed protein product [Cylindrotheca closterium]|uniref:Uncharacterized protein n=1 Tax=Cylindrotheca closterium TaxID=2856 RepID=A0AAD2JI59_9STRA|nr:unnamed protein product [Cylindrotheca closterium]